MCDCVCPNVYLYAYICVISKEFVYVFLEYDKSQDL